MNSDAKNFDDKNASKQQVALYLMTTIPLGSTYVYNLPQALQTQLMSPPFNLSYVEFNSFYSIYSFPNIIIPVLSSYIIHIIGLRTSVIIYSLLIVLGQAILTAGVFWKSLAWMLFGRIIYALGAESLTVAQSVISTKWFSSQKLTSALGWNNSIAFLGSNLNIVLSPLIYAYTELLWLPCVVGLVICLFSFSSALGYAVIDYKRDAKIAPTTDEPEKKGKYSDLKKAPKLYLLLCVYYFIHFLSFDGVTSNINDQIHRRFGLSNTVAGQLVLAYYIQLMLFAPLIGRLTDAYGGRVYWLLTSALVSAVAQAMLAFLPDDDFGGWLVIFPLILLGFADNVFETVTWSCLLLSLDPSLTGVGFALATASVNLWGAFGMVALGKIQDETLYASHGYLYSQLFLGVLSMIAASVGLLILNEDQQTGGTLSAVQEIDEERVKLKEH